MDAIYERLNDDLQKPEVILRGPSDVQNFYADKSLVLTGATGFMGKCLVEKILRSCPGLKRLYVIVRQKKDVTPEEKMKKYFENEIFDNLRRIDPNFEQKVTTVRGDLEEDKLGMPDVDRKLITENADLIIHNGATTKFDEKISIALKTNVLATKHMLDIAMDCKHLQAFLYISTAYSHCYQKKIEEKFYDSPCDLKMVYDIIARDQATEEGLNENALEKILGKWVNIYTFTKSLAEDLVKQYGDKASFPCGVYRPSIVTASYNEPCSGWISNKGGPAYAFLGMGLGAVHAAYYEGHPMDLIPVDYSINSIIVATYDLPRQWKTEKRAVMYNYGSSVLNPVNFNEIYDSLEAEAGIIGSTKLLWYPYVILCRKKWAFYFFHIFLHFFPAVLADIAFLCLGKKQRALSIFFFATRHLDKLFYFTNGNWRIHCERIMEVYDKLNDVDRAIFSFDIRTLDWEDFCIRYARYGRIHLVHDPLENQIEGVKNYRRMKRLHFTILTLLALLSIYYACNFIASFF